MSDAARRVPAARRERRRAREGELRPAHDAPYYTQLVGAGRAVREGDTSPAVELLGPVWKSTSENLPIEQTQYWEHRSVDGVEPPRRRADAVTGRHRADGVRRLNFDCHAAADEMDGAKV